MEHELMHTSSYDRSNTLRYSHTFFFFVRWECIMNHNTSPRLYYMGPAFMREAVRMQRAHATKVGWDPGGIPTYVLPT